MIENLLAIEWSIVISVSLITSFIFFLCMAFIRPIVKVSNNILWGTKKDKKTGEDIKFFKIKAVNWTFANLYEVKIQLNLVTSYGDGNGTFSVRYTNIPFKKDQFLYIPSMLLPAGRKHAEYAQIFISYEDIDKIWEKDSQYLEFSMVAKHGFSGFNKVIKKQFTDKDVIK